MTHSKRQWTCINKINTGSILNPNLKSSSNTWNVANFRTGHSLHAAKIQQSGYHFDLMSTCKHRMKTLKEAKSFRVNQTQPFLVTVLCEGLRSISLSFTMANEWNRQRETSETKMKIPYVGSDSAEMECVLRSHINIPQAAFPLLTHKRVSRPFLVPSIPVMAHPKAMMTALVVMALWPIEERDNST